MSEDNADTHEVMANGILPNGTGLIVDANGTVDFGDPPGAGQSHVAT